MAKQLEALTDIDPIARYEATVMGMQLEVAHIMDEAVGVGLETAAGKALVTDAQQMSRSIDTLRASDIDGVNRTYALLKSLHRARTAGPQLEYPE